MTPEERRADLAKMIVRDGDDAVASGVVLGAPPKSGGRLLLMPDYLSVTATDIPEKAILTVSGGRLPGAGTRVDVAGMLSDGVLYPHTVTRLPGSDPGASSTASRANRARAFTSEQLQEALGELDDVVTTFWLDEGEGVFWVAATDPERVRRRLEAVVAQPLVVLPSRWTPTEISSANRLLDQLPRSLVLSRGEAHGDDHQLRLRLTVRNVTDAVAALLGDVPAALVDVRVLVRPAQR